MTLIGFHITFLNGVGTIEATAPKKHPGAFGPNGGKSRALAIPSIIWTLGSFVGPVVAGTINDKVGYYTMNYAIGEYLHVFDILLANSRDFYSWIMYFVLYCCISLPPGAASKDMSM
ncbi:hypothetical protein N7471_007660, partial [Penicillium samsonianum]|uniref:uncharacterized protein n=1 Tax=Penicillium samsonianum TaxID=1882272 RepID=UPI0025489F12